MDIVTNFLENGGKSIVDGIAQKVGIDSESVTSIINNLVPELNNGVQSKISSGPAGFTSLLEGIDMSSLSKVVSGDQTIEGEEADNLGSVLLNNIFGGEEGKGNLLKSLTDSTGISTDKIQSAIPQLTTAFISYFSQSSGGISDLMSSLSGDGSMMDTVSSMLDSDGDGEISDDLLNAAKKLF